MHVRARPCTPDLLDPQRGCHGEGDGRDGVLDGGGECGRRVVQAQQVETLVRRDPDRSTMINIMVSSIIIDLPLAILAPPEIKAAEAGTVERRNKLTDE
jgi:hypothetical protein